MATSILWERNFIRSPVTLNYRHEEVKKLDNDDNYDDVENDNEDVANANVYITINDEEENIEYFTSLHFTSHDITSLHITSLHFT